MVIYYETEEEFNVLRQLLDAALKVGGIQNLDSVNALLRIVKKHECNKNNDE